MNINDIMLQGDAGSGTTEASSKYYNVGKNNAVTADAGYLGIRSKAVQTDFMMPQLQGLRESGSENYTGRQATEIAADRVQNDNAASRNLKVVTGEDCAALEDADSALEEYQKSSLERAVKRIREEREWKADRMEENKELREQLANDLEKMQQQGFLAQKSEAQIRDALQEANLPATKEFVDKVAGTLQMSMSINEMTDAAKVYVIQNGTQPTIEAVYQGMHSGSTAVDNASITEKDMAAYAPQIEHILQQIGRGGASDQAMAKWLFANELPITAENMQTLEMLDQMQQSTCLEITLQQIVQTMAMGLPAEQTVPGDKGIWLAGDLIQQVKEITAQDVEQVTTERADPVLQDYLDAHQTEQGASDHEVGQTAGTSSSREVGQSAGVPSDRKTGQGAMNISDRKVGQEAANTSDRKVGQETTAMAGELSGQETAEVMPLPQVTAWRQLEEIRLKMTIPAVMSMRAQGISVETESLAELVGRLREIEMSYYRTDQTGEAAVTEDAQIHAMQDAVTAVREIAEAPAELLGSSLRQHELMTVRELHGAAISATKSAWQYQQDYEAVGTQVRTDLGDSIKKAFAGIPTMLQEMGLESTPENERAVRILGYNRMEITEESIAQIKDWDAEVNTLIDRMKPATVLGMIRDGINPLEHTVTELNEMLADRGMTAAQEEESYSKFLWRLDKTNGITAEERQSYIGIYRLLHQVQKEDHAAVGAVVQSGQQMDLSNLLTAVRSRNAQGMDHTVDDTENIIQAAAGNQTITDQIMTAYYEERAGELRDMAKRSQKADGFLEEAGLPDTVGNMQAALRLLDGETALDTVLELARESQSEQDVVGQLASETANAAVLETAMDHVVPQGVAASEASSEKETFAERRRDLTELTDGLKDVMEAIADGEEDEAALAEYCAGIDHFLENILEKTKQRADITYSEFQEIRATRGLMRLQQGLRNNRSYAVPIQTADGVTQMNLTFREDEEQAGKVQVTIWQPYRISMEMQISGRSLKGLVLCDDRAGYEKLKQQAGALQEILEQNVCPVKTISYGMDFRAQNDYSAASENDNAVDTKALYQTAKVLVQYISEVVATENGGLQ